LPTYTFNAAGVHPNTIAKVDSQAKAKEKEIIKAYYTDDDPLSWVQDNPKKMAAMAGGAEIAINSIPGGKALEYYFAQKYVKNNISKQTDSEISMASNNIIDEALISSISIFSSLPPALGERINLGNTGCEGMGCGHKIDPLIKRISAPLEKAKTEIDISKENLKMILSNCAASE